MKGEQAEQVMLFDWIRLKPNIAPYAFHIANERRCSPQRGKMLKRSGVRAGVSDVFVAISRGGYHGLWIELKYGKGKPTSNQEKFMVDMSSQGYYCVWVVGAMAAIKAIEDYLNT